MAQRVRKSYRGLKNRPSSATQLPILAALHAGLPTLFVTNIQDFPSLVKTQFVFLRIYFVLYGFHGNIVLYLINVMQRFCRGGYQPPARYNALFCIRYGEFVQH